MSIAEDELRIASPQSEVKVECIACRREHPLAEANDACLSCGSLLEVHHPLETLKTTINRAWLEQRRSERGFPYGSGVWRWRELVAPFPNETLVSRNEGNTNLYEEVALYKKPNTQTMHQAVC